MSVDFQLFFHFILPKILVSTLCGAIIGFERELKNKTAGIRTNILICVGCTLYTMIPDLMVSENNNIDPTRVISQIITGVGFLGAGVIMKTNDKIVGVTTAAFIWVVSAIGILIGILDFFWTPLLITIGLLLINKAFRKVEKHIQTTRKLEKHSEEQDV